MTDRSVSPEVREIFNLFFDGTPVSAKEIDTSRGGDDFRKTFIIDTKDERRYVLKITSNDFTFPDRISVWQRTVEEYRALGYYSPLIYRDKTGTFPSVVYAGKHCVAYAEEHSRYLPMEDRTNEDGSVQNIEYSKYFHDIWTMTAKIAAKRLSYTDYPSAYCLFETFCPSDKMDEVMENALAWKEYAATLPDQFAEQIQRIWKLWNDNRENLKKVYTRLPTSVFQADLNSTNILVDENGRFAGIYDYNLSGKDVFLNYLIRENGGDFEEEIESIQKALKTASEYYLFTSEEKEAALPLYRCLKPLWFTRVEELKKAGGDLEAVKRCLDRTEFYLTAEIDFKSYMD